MPKLLASSGDAALVMLGNYNFGDASLFIPEVDTVPAAESNILGSMYHVKVSGVLAVQSGALGGDYAIFPLGSLPFNALPNEPLSPLELATGNLHFWGQESGIDVGIGSGVDQWYNSYGGNSVQSYTALPAGGGWVESGVTPAGKDVIHFVQGASMGLTEPNADLIMTTANDPIAMICVVKQLPMATNGAIWGGGRTTDDFLEQFLFYTAQATDTITALHRDNGSTVSVAADTIRESDGFQVLTFVHDGTDLKVWQSGTLVAGPTSWGGADAKLINQFGIGYWARLSSDTHNSMDIAEIAMWESGLSDNDRNSAQLYMAQKHGIDLANSGI